MSTGLYLGGVYPKTTFGKSFAQDVVESKNPIDVIYDFSDPFLTSIPSQTGAFGFKKSLKEAVASTEFKKQIASKNKRMIDFDFVEWVSYKDVEKSFGANAPLGSFFSAKVKSNSEKTNIKGRLMAKLIIPNFDVFMDTPQKGIFANPDYNRQDSQKTPPRGGAKSYGDHVYVKSIVFGKVAFVAIESEYTYSEIKTAISASLKIGLFGGGGSSDQKTTDVFNKSTVTAIVLSENSQNHFYSDIESVKSVFGSNFTEGSYGLPIYCQGRYVFDHSTYVVPETSTESDRSRRKDRDSISSERDRTGGTSNGSGRVTSSRDRTGRTGGNN